MSAPPAYTESGNKGGYPPPQPGYQSPPAGYYNPSPAGGYPPPQPGHQTPPAGYYNSPPAGAYPQPQHSHTVTVVQTAGGCPRCQGGYFADSYGCCAIFLAIFFFPIGILCCLAMKERRCQNCGYGS